MSFKFEAEVRSAQGKGASRRLRHNGQVPAIIYGGNAEPVSIILDHDKVNNVQIHDAFYNEVLTIVLAEKEVQVKVQAIQRHPTKPKLLHLDFKRV
ncbi:50S ribosomal protein L25 [[Haemophilus] ducreyi]|uniref:Large ribosomal subunit protein bL25 n=2 Tax=Haemophilus ducreyi TaxID=730 RepID=RL25_HAEDU|nr:50S ribosomal protein L25 [[Haemophilus] ducreyi]Q7VLY6.1 RecName: Full=Large ribosomal subunit protein bL25; AltName: Full=50S ribosomal protein L25 [[Haemophilus] ducreyi 35000HP]AAP96084.1 50S ribosomal protein L25 [[Haemophilus] ducreyi 35000HP]AKO31066.1 50S ribosomal protein L25 [[Haemophilus] ducreyi]AKO32510.1 50S ribosomal protein L25 [[Haemophilus] ducreyi]AKO33961.1 50S ribosomal protein L25 [[Haemophilus] ducreyi]AKO35408.1 50S ribosomal protein L25 [[Haemophilus] ducreyi]